MTCLHLGGTNEKSYQLMTSPEANVVCKCSNFIRSLEFCLECAAVRMGGGKVLPSRVHRRLALGQVRIYAFSREIPSFKKQ